MPATTAGSGLRALSEAIAAVTTPILARHGRPHTALLADWPAIVGERLAAHTLPQRVAYPPRRRAAGTLHLRVDSPSLAVELQHLAPLILERVNARLGPEAVAKLHLIQAPLPAGTGGSADASTPVAEPLPVEATCASHFATDLSGVADPTLRARLNALARRLPADDTRGSAAASARADGAGGQRSRRRDR